MTTPAQYEAAIRFLEMVQRAYPDFHVEAESALAIVREAREVQQENARLRAELEVRDDSEFTALHEATDAIERVLDRLDEGDEWKKPPTPEVPDAR